RVADVAMPFERSSSQGCRVALQALFLVVQQRLDRSDVDDRHGSPVVSIHTGQERKERCLRLTAGGRGEDDDVLSVQDRAGRCLLYCAQLLESQGVHNLVLKHWRQAFEGAAHVSSWSDGGLRSSSMSSTLRSIPAASRSSAFMSVDESWS